MSDRQQLGSPAFQKAFILLRRLKSQTCVCLSMLFSSHGRSVASTCRQPWAPLFCDSFQEAILPGDHTPVPGSENTLPLLTHVDWEVVYPKPKQTKHRAEDKTTGQRQQQQVKKLSQSALSSADLPQGELKLQITSSGSNLTPAPRSRCGYQVTLPKLTFQGSGK